MDKGKIIEVLQTEKGRQFDPDMAKTFLAALSDMAYTSRTPNNRELYHTPFCKNIENILLSTFTVVRRTKLRQLKNYNACPDCSPN